MSERAVDLRGDFDDPSPATLEFSPSSASMSKTSSRPVPTVADRPRTAAKASRPRRRLRRFCGVCDKRRVGEAPASKKQLELTCKVVLRSHHFFHQTVGAVNPAKGLLDLRARRASSSPSLPRPIAHRSQRLASDVDSLQLWEHPRAILQEHFGSCT